MKYKVVVLEPVNDELTEAAIYYDNQQSGLGIALVEEWDKSLSHIQQAPEGYQKKKKQFRQAILNKFPYLIIFEIEGSNIIILRFIHARKHPKRRYTKKK